MPRVAVLMPVRDAARTVRAAAASILRQTFRDLALVCVDDGSTDGTPAVLARLAERDRRVEVVRGPGEGIARALGRGLARCDAEVIARMDADDVAHPSRLALQLEALDADPALAAVGSRVRLFPRGAVRAGMARYAAWLNGLVTPALVRRVIEVFGCEYVQTYGMTETSPYLTLSLLHPHLAGSRESRARFSREARAVARLAHPGIVEIYDYAGEGAVESYLVTELVRGRTLRAFAQEVGFGHPELGLLVGRALADALVHAHSAGVIHRDLKPENVLVKEGDAPAVKLADFGIARILASDERMTLTGALVGSPHHMAPEIVEGKDADARSDLFSLGTVLYWLATGALPFAASNPTAILRRVLEGDYRDPRAVDPRVPDPLADLVASCLAVDPARRPQSAADVRDAIDRILAQVGLDRPDEADVHCLDAPCRAHRHEAATEQRGHLGRAGREVGAPAEVPRAHGDLAKSPWPARLERNGAPEPGEHEAVAVWLLEAEEAVVRAASAHHGGREVQVGRDRDGDRREGRGPLAPRPFDRPLDALDERRPGLVV